MDLKESAKVASEIAERSRKKRLVVTSIVLCGVLMAMMLVMILFIQYQDANTLKAYIDGKEVSVNNFIKDAKGTRYINVSLLAKRLDWTYTKGKYNVFDEDPNSGYVTSTHEVVDLTAGEKTYAKFLVNEDEGEKQKAHIEKEKEIYGKELVLASPSGTKEVFELQYPILADNGNLYVALSDVGVMFNLRVKTDGEYRVKFFTLNYLFTRAQAVATKVGYTQFSDIYENMRDLIDYRIVCGRSVSKYGVVQVDVSNNKATEAISCAYNKLVFLQNVNEYFVYVNNTCALYSNDGKAIIKPQEFDEITVLDQGAKAEDRLYMVKKNNKYGVLNRVGEVIVHSEFDKIGLSAEDFGGDKTMLNELENENLLFNKLIPVKLKGKYGFFSIDGRQIVDTVYEGVGYRYTDKTLAASLQSGQSGTLIIPELLGIKGVVIMKDGNAGIFDAQAEKLIIPAVCSEVYKLLKSGETNYYMVFNGQVLEIGQYLKDHDLVSVREEPKQEKNEVGNLVYDKPVSTEGNNTTTNNVVTNETVPAEKSVETTQPQQTESKPQEQQPQEQQPVEQPQEQQVNPPAEENPVQQDQPAPEQPQENQPVENQPV